MKMIVLKIRLNERLQEIVLSQIVFLIAAAYMLNKRTILWQKKTRYLQRFSVPYLRRPYLHVLFRTSLLIYLRRLEANLCPDAEVGDDVEDDFLEHCILLQLLKNIVLRIQFIRVHWSQVHHVPDIQIVDPIVVVFDAESVAYVDFKAFIGLKCYNFVEVGELGLKVERLYLFTGQVFQTEIFSYSFKLVQKRLSIDNMFFLNICALQNLVRGMFCSRSLAVYSVFVFNSL